MYLRALTVANFRTFGDPGTAFEFRQGINLVIGENNVGKSALADALRILFSLGPGRRDVYVTPTDFHCSPTGDPTTEIRFDAVFSGLTEEEQGAFHELLVLSDPPSAELHVRLQLVTGSGQPRVRQIVWGGEVEGQTISASTHEMISHVFLGALRDAEADLRPGRGSRLGQLVRRIVNRREDRERIVGHAAEANKRILNEELIQRSADTVNRHLAALAGPKLRQTVRVGFMPPVFERVADSLRPLLPNAGRSTFVAVYQRAEWDKLRGEAGAEGVVLDRIVNLEQERAVVDLASLQDDDRAQLPEPVFASLLEHIQGAFGVEQNGLGYNNLIYMGVVLGDLVERYQEQPYSYNALIIEEPEAHLHPQLQVLVYSFLDQTSRAAGGTPKVQVFVTSHSPTLASRADLDSLLVLYRGHTGGVGATSISRCPLSPTEKLDLKRYIDVTRSQLFFAKAVLLVEGISEALILPPLALRAGLRIDQSSIEVVPVSGVSFGPFAKLFNSEDANQRLDLPCAIVTDDDRCTGKGNPDKLKDEDTLQDRGVKLARGQASPRCENVKALAGGRLGVWTASRTLEVELGRIAANLPLIIEALRGLGHPKIAGELERDVATVQTEWERGALVLDSLASFKADVAQRLAALLYETEGEGFKHAFELPPYLHEALKHIMLPAPPAAGEP